MKNEIGEWVIEFRAPDCPPWWAGRARDGSLGIAFHIETAEVYATKEIAERFLKNGYGSQNAVVRKLEEVE